MSNGAGLVSLVYTSFSSIFSCLQPTFAGGIMLKKQGDGLVVRWPPRGPAWRHYISYKVANSLTFEQDDKIPPESEAGEAANILVSSVPASRGPFSSIFFSRSDLELMNVKTHLSQHE